MVSSLSCSFTHDNRTLDNNQLTALDVGLFDKNTALQVLCVDQESVRTDVRKEIQVAGQDFEWAGGRSDTPGPLKRLELRDP